MTCCGLVRFYEISAPDFYTERTYPTYPLPSQALVIQSDRPSARAEPEDGGAFCSHRRVPPLSHRAGTMGSAREHLTPFAF